MSRSKRSLARVFQWTMMAASLGWSVCLEAAPAAGPAPAACSAPEFRQLDFWQGDWNLFDVDDRSHPAAHVRVTPMLDGCALREIYEGADGLVGESFTIYDVSSKLWHQTWVTNRGQLLRIDGRFQGDTLTLRGARTSADGREELVEATWQPEGKGVREIARTSLDGGKTWKPWFDAMFQRR